MDMGIMDGGIVVLAALFLLLVAGFVLWGAILIIPWWRSRGHHYPSCGGCGYDLTGSLGRTTACPECGSSLERVGIRPIDPRPSVASLVGLAMLVMGLAVGIPYMLSVFLG